MRAARKRELLRRLALDGGFHRVGLAALRPPATGAAYLRWLERGDHASMGYLERRAERLDPASLLPGARSAVCVAVDYDAEDGDGLWRGVARYARGRDYHNVMGKRLRKLAARIRETFPGTATRPHVDTGPLLERDLASAAGLGAIGKNTLLLHPEAGSYFLLGEVLTSLELEIDREPAIADLCGSCSACLEACPTGALPQPYRLDSRRCISYWTIEHRGAIPDDMRPQIGEWLFGCDLCQEACPHNEGVEGRGDPALAFDPSRADLGLDEILEMSETAYDERFRGSPMRRARRQGLRRNAAVVMGNSGRRRWVPPLSRALSAADAIVREHAAWALGRLAAGDAVASLSEALETEAVPSVRDALRRAIERCSAAAPEAGERH